MEVPEVSERHLKLQPFKSVQKDYIRAFQTTEKVILIRLYGIKTNQTSDHKKKKQVKR
jgi:hypothetical protein